MPAMSGFRKLAVPGVTSAQTPFLRKLFAPAQNWGSSLWRRLLPSLVLAPVTLASYLFPPPLDVLTLEPMRNIAHTVEVDRLVGEDAI
jgi:hypothetical protein